jgi:hypothetical protein
LFNADKTLHCLYKWVAKKIIPNKMANHLSETTLRKLRRIGKTFNALAAISPKLAGKIAFRLFCSPRRLPVRDQDRSFYAKAKESKVAFEGYTLRTYEWTPAQPNGKTVLLIHGWESSAARWRNLTKTLLQAGYCVQAFDAPASGQSGGKMLNLMIFSRALQAVVQAKGLPYAIVGHSLGAGAPVIAMTFLGLDGGLRRIDACHPRFWSDVGHQ